MCYRCQEVGGGDGKYSVIIVVYVLYSICNVVFSSDTKPIGVIAKPQLVVLNTYENNSYDNNNNTVSPGAIMREN